MTLTGESEVLGEIPVPVPLSQLEISRGLASDRTHPYELHGGQSGTGKKFNLNYTYITIHLVPRSKHANSHL